MFKSRLLDALRYRSLEKPDGEISQAVAKMENQERLSTEEFLKVYETLWREGPIIKYQSPVARERELEVINQNPNL